MQFPREQKYNYQMTIFDPARMEHQIAKGPNRALAVFDIIERLISNGIAPVEETRRAWQRGQPSQAAFVVHNLINSLGNFGGKRVCDISVDLERLFVEDENNNHIPALLDALELELTHFLKQAQMWLDSKKVSYQLSNTSSTAIIEVALAALKKELQDSNLKALETFSQLEKYLVEQLGEQQYHNLQNALRNLNFDAALHIIASVRQIPSAQF